MRYRRLARDYERTITHYEATIWWATVFMTKRLTRYETQQPPPGRWAGQRPRTTQQTALPTDSEKVTPVKLPSTHPAGVTPPAGSHGSIGVT
jgi:hypothetical protein